MNAATALRLAQAANVSVTLDGNDLLLEAGCAPPPEILEMISRYKSDVIALLRPAQDGWSIEAWQAFFHERAGIAEYDGGLSRSEAEALAFDHCVVEWLLRRPVRSSPGFCLGCGCAKTNEGSYCRSAQKLRVMRGFIRIVGQHGTPGARQKLSPLSTL